MASFNGGIDVPLVAGSSVATTAAQYQPVYLSGENTVDLMNTTTTIGKFLGVLQNYAKTAGDAVSVRVLGVTKAVLNTDSTTAGDQVEVFATTTGGFIRATIRSEDRLSLGAMTISCQPIGRVIRGSQGGTGSVFSLLLRPNISSAITVTVSASA